MEKRKSLDRDAFCLKENKKQNKARLSILSFLFYLLPNSLRRIPPTLPCYDCYILPFLFLFFLSFEIINYFYWDVLSFFLFARFEFCLLMLVCLYIFSSVLSLKL